MSDIPTEQQLREAGFTLEALKHPRDELGLRLLCAFNGVDPKLAPPAWYFHPNAGSAKAWKRVADVAIGLNVSVVRELASALTALLAINESMSETDASVDKPSEQQVEDWWNAMVAARTALRQFEDFKNG